MRGRTFKNTFIIGDEMQNSTPTQMKMLLTRLGESSKVVVTGDIQQNDITGGKENGLQDIITKTKKYTSLMSKKHEVDIESMNSVQIIEFNNQHIERSKVVRKILDIYAVDSIQEKQDTRKVESKNTATQEEQNEFKKWSEEE